MRDHRNRDRHRPDTRPGVGAPVGRLGLRLALDDFGTGYGGLTYLKRLRAELVKIDVDFVRDLPENPESQHVVKAIVNLAQGFGRKTVAEGVENEKTLELLERLGVDYAQRDSGSADPRRSRRGPHPAARASRCRNTPNGPCVGATFPGVRSSIPWWMEDDGTLGCGHVRDYRAAARGDPRSAAAAAFPAGAVGRHASAVE